MSNCKKGDLAYIVVPPGFLKTIDQKYVDVGVDGECELGTIGLEPSWICRFHVPWYCDAAKKWISQCTLLDSWLRPIRHPGEDATDETLLMLPAPSAETAAA